MPFTNYTELQAVIADELERDDLTTAIPDFIRLAESRIRRDIRVRELLQRDSITINARQISLPDNFLEAIELRILNDPVTVLEYLNLHEMTRFRTSGTGTPSRFTVHTEIEFDKPPDESMSGEIIFYEQVAALETTATNTILTNYPDLYFYGSLMASATRLMHDERVPLWAQLYKEAKDSANGTSRRSRRIGPQVSQVVGRGP